MATVTILRKATAVIIVDRVEPVIPFWTKLGLAAVTQVPDANASNGRLGFVILAAEGIEVMYQTSASVKEDLLKSASVKEAFRTGPQQTTLFVEVTRLAEVETRLRDEKLIMPRRTTFYGTTEIGYADPAGNIIVFAEHHKA